MSSAAAITLPGIVAHLERFLEPLAETDQLAARFLIAGETFEAAPEQAGGLRRQDVLQGFPDDLRGGFSQRGFDRTADQ